MSVSHFIIHTEMYTKWNYFTSSTFYRGKHTQDGTNESQQCKIGLLLPINLRQKMPHISQGSAATNTR